MNRIRVPWIRRTLLNYYFGAVEDKPKSEAIPLAGLSILDVGCGAGLLSESLARLGATVTGLDASSDCVRVATDHAASHLEADAEHRLRYICGSVEELDPKPEFDAVVASEILEHVPDRSLFVAASVRLLKPGGVIFFSTLNKTLLAQVLGIWAAEQVLGIVPKGTHQLDKFTPPEDLQFLLENEGCSVRLIHGLCYNPLAASWHWTRGTDLNYALHAVKTMI